MSPTRLPDGLGGDRLRTAVRDLDRRLAAAALVALSAAVGAAAYGVAHDDVVTVLGAALFVPTAVLLGGLAVRASRRNRPGSGGAA